MRRRPSVSFSQSLTQCVSQLIKDRAKTKLKEQRREMCKYIKVIIRWKDNKVGSAV